MLKLLALYLDIAMWRRGPQDVPTVGILLPLTIGAYVLLSILLGEALPSLRAGWWVEVLIDTLFVAAWYWLLLLFAHRRERYRQTATALFGLQIVLAAPTIATLWLLQHLANDKTLQTSVLYVIPVLASWLTVLVWALLATAHILRVTLERSLALCLMLTTMLLLANINVAR
jgi:hypothetical protein